MAARKALANAKQIMFQENAKELKRVVELHHQTLTANEAIYEERFECQRQAWEQFQHLQMFHENGVKEVAVERAELAARAASIEAASCVRKQETQIQLKKMSTMSERSA